MIRPSFRFACALVALAAGAPAAAQSFALPADPTLCADLAVSIRFVPGRDHVRAVIEVRNLGPGAHAAGRPGATLAVATSSNTAGTQTARFDLGALAAGQCRSLWVSHPGAAAAFSTWALIEAPAGAGTDCNPANNADVRAFGA
jgi:hypothetical protein